jgi:hypothetical protein
MHRTPPPLWRTAITACLWVLGLCVAITALAVAAVLIAT